MRTINVLQDKKFPVYELIDTDSNAWMHVVPEKGGIITSLGFEGEELLYLNEETLWDEDKNIRGGIPILFPICGFLHNKQYEWNGNTFTMNNHGVARNHPWQVLATNDSDELSITIGFSSNEKTKMSFPFQFDLVFTYVLEQNNLKIIQEYKNNSSAEMPMYAGFHPYFLTPDKQFHLDSDATIYEDHNDMHIKPFTGEVDLENKQEAFILLDSKERSVGFTSPSLNKKITLAYGEEFGYIVLWTEANKSFVCVEPWMAMPDELNRKEALHLVQPGSSLTTTFSIIVDEKN
ncbi:aldose epimerase [Radiobacillus sp. PE A8.2]|uniref:aldose epimerase family protein n=1 Tax=Radiobacillus sp. PE A8.2 TaxID=3380349 RepID=UPI0038910BEF